MLSKRTIALRGKHKEREEIFNFRTFSKLIYFTIFELYFYLLFIESSVIVLMKFRSR